VLVKPALVGRLTRDVLHVLLGDVLQNTEGGDTDSGDEADRLEEVESYLRVYDPDFKTLAADICI